MEVWYKRECVVVIFGPRGFPGFEDSFQNESGKEREVEIFLIVELVARS